MDINYCYQCGTAVSEEDTFCGNCEVKLDGPVTANEKGTDRTSRRHFLKAAAAGAAGVGAPGILSQPAVAQDSQDLPNKTLRVYTDDADIPYQDRSISDEGADVIDALRNLKNEFGNGLKKVELPSGNFDIDPASTGTLTWDLSADIIGQGGARSANRGGDAATAIACRSEYSGSLIKVTRDDVNLEGLYFSMNRNGGNVLEFDQGDFGVVQDVGAAQIGGSTVYVHNGSHRCTIRHFYTRGADLNQTGDEAAIKVERTTNNVRQTVIDTVIITNCYDKGILLSGVAPVDIRNAFTISNGGPGIYIGGAGAVSIRSSKLEGNQSGGLYDSGRLAELMVEDGDWGSPGFISVRDTHFNLNSAGYYIEAGNSGTTLSGMLVEGCTFASEPNNVDHGIRPRGTVGSEGLHVRNCRKGWSGSLLMRSTKDHVRNDVDDGWPLQTVSLNGVNAVISPNSRLTNDLTVKIDAGPSGAGVRGITNVNDPGRRVTLIHTGRNDVTLIHNAADTNHPLINQDGKNHTLTANNQMAVYKWDGTAWRQTALNQQ